MSDYAKAYQHTIYRIDSGTAPSPSNALSKQMVAAQVTSEAVISDTHKAYDSNKGTFTVPVAGVYSVTSMYYTEKGTTTHSKFVQVNAGDTIELETIYIPKVGDLVLFCERTVLEVLSVSQSGVVGKVINSVDKSNIGIDLPFPITNMRKVDKDFNLETYRLLYVKEDQK